MQGFRIAALALPAVAAFLAPALWAWRPGWKATTVGVLALVGVVLAWGVIAGASGAALAATAVMSVAVAAFALGLHLAAGQVVSGLAVVLVSSTLFLAPPVVEDAVRLGRPAQPRSDFLLSVNPWAALAAGPFKIDLFRDLTSMYRSGVADYADARTPPWGSVAAGYAAGGLLLGAAAWGVRRIRRRAPPLQAAA